MTERKD